VGSSMRSRKGKTTVVYAEAFRYRTRIGPGHESAPAFSLRTGRPSKPF
jgi:hypothetical protein